MASNQRTDGSVEIGCADPQHERIGLACPTCGAVAVHTKAKPLSDAAVQGLMEWPHDDDGYCRGCTSAANSDPDPDLDWPGSSVTDPARHAADCKIARHNACLVELLEGRARLAKVREWSLAPLAPLIEGGTYRTALRCKEAVLAILGAPVDRTGDVK